MQVTKRDGTKVLFDFKKPYEAIMAACEDAELDEISSMALASKITHDLAAMDKDMSVEEIQEFVINRLRKSNGKVAKAYSSYRRQQNALRMAKAELIKVVIQKLTASNVQNQNANIDEYSFGGRMGEAASEVFKWIALNVGIKQKFADNHRENRNYIHDLNSWFVGMHNCYDAKTEFITKDGVKSFGSCSDGQKVIVLDCAGRWREATVHKYGKQKMYNLTFKSGLTTKTVTCTRNHRWVLEDGKVTDNIQLGDSLYLANEVKNEYTYNPALWCFGFVLGDGCDFIMRSKDRTRITNSGMKVRLCGHKNEHLDTFLSCGWSISQTYPNGDNVVISRGNGAYKQSFLDNKMWRLMSYDDLCNVINGLLAADGHVFENGSVSFSTSDIRIKEFIEYASSTAGYYLWSSKEKHSSTNYKDDRTLYEFHLSKKQSVKWTLEEIKPSYSGDNGEVVAWCVEEPVTHTFTLQGAMVTGNCLSLPIDSMMKKGVEVRQTDIRTANSIDTFLQLVAVYFQVQSLQQFGGVSATHLDWSAVPYIRRSFYKWYNIVAKFVPFAKQLDFDTEKIESTCITDTVYSGRRFNFIKRFVHRFAMFLTERETKQGVEGLLHNLNSLQSRSGNQLPFTSINYGTCTSFEGRMFTRLMLEGTIKGVGKFHRTAVFPCGIFQYKKGINDKPGTPNYDLFQLAIKCVAKRLYPNFCNCDWSVQKQAEEFDFNVRKAVIQSLSDSAEKKLIARLRKDPKLAYNLGLKLVKTSKKQWKLVVIHTDFPCALSSTMGCRTWNGADINFGEVYERNIYSVIAIGEMEFPDFLSAIQKDGRGNIAPNTVILPKIAMEAKVAAEENGLNESELIDNFLARLDDAIADSRDELIDRFNHIASQPEKAASFMWDNNTMVGYVPEEGVISALKHGTLAIGQIGLAETLQILVGCDHTEEKGMELAKKIEYLFNTRCSEFKKEYHLNFGVYYTPAENLCYTAMQKFKEEYGEIPNVSDREFFTNSMHVPVWKEVNPFQKIDIEAQLTGYSNAGCITYVEFDNSAKHNLEALEKVVHYAMDKDIPYFAINLPNDTCMKCGYTDEINDCCPMCGGSIIMRLRRVTGYLSTDFLHFNLGKINEVLARFKHSTLMEELDSFKYEGK